MAAKKTPAARRSSARDDHAHHARPVRLRHSPEAFGRAAHFFRALGDGPRVKLLACLLEREWCVTELAEALGQGLSAISQRLRVLREHGLVSSRREGKHVYYKLADEHVVQLLDAAMAHASEPLKGAPTPMRQ